MRVLLGCFMLSLLVACGLSAPDSASDSASDKAELEKRKAELEKRLELENRVVFSHVVGTDTPKGRGALLLKEKIKNQGLSYDGELQVYPDSLLFNDTKVIDALKENKVQLAAPSISKLAKYNQKLQIFDFPFLFKDIEEVEKFYAGVKNEIFTSEGDTMYLDKDKEKEDKEKKKEEKEYVVLGLWHGGMKQLSSSREITQSSDKPLKNLKIRIQSSDVFKLTFKALGATPVIEDDFKKVRQRLKKREIDGQENTWSNSYTEKYHEDEVQKYFVETNHSYLGYLLVTNKAFWSELGKRSRYGRKYDDIWKTEIKEVTQEVKNLAQKSNDTGKQKITDYHKELPSLNEEQRKRWCESVYNQALAKEWEKIVKEIGETIIQAAIAEKTGCPFDNLKGVLDQGKDIPD